MREVIRGFVTTAAVLAFSGAAFAGQATSTKPAKPAAPAAAAKVSKAPKAAKTTAITASGTISKYDAASNTLTLTTAKGDVSFMVDNTATVYVSGKKMMASDLSSNVGHKATVRYTDSGGSKMASSVRVTGVPKASASGATKKSATPKKS